MVLLDENKKEDKRIVGVVYAAQNKGCDKISNKELFGIINAEYIGKEVWGVLCDKKGNKIGTMWAAPSLSSTSTKEHGAHWQLEVWDLEKKIIASLSSPSFDDSVNHITHTSLYSYKVVSESKALKLGFSQEAIDKCLA